ncbi:MAG: L-2-amino-thiazoline-4-carboxylic acid hydrolase [Candidatus Coatesbacteria bacterium]|nr:MAG: L-2-amino-thiazoline-4-carboxylic acid hydrolase [Candidatus Coatesbacteria bacterium]
MDVKDLKNYGVDVASAMAAVPPAVREKLEAASRRVALKRLGLFKALRLPSLIEEEERKMRDVDLASFRERGLDNEAFLAQARYQVAAFAAVARLVGTEKAVAVFEEVMREVGGELWAEQAPTGEDFNRCGEGFAAFRAYFEATMAANRRAGVLDFEVVEDGDDAFQYDVTACVFYDLAKRLGYPEAARHLCFTDDVYFPEVGREIGLRFLRAGTLARGDRRCDFRFERVSEPAP